ncbi:hypothetical protein EYF80_065984 [Liparis tanakae]|uniref:Mucin-like domain-containing protein n=1 Tax=Liparis tanakae TaxID=230148 RepID=A0A4Z2E5K6_9TELE|nr:hypothetical protein EYF80_065984 [Liparis tanakae]
MHDAPERLFLSETPNAQEEITPPTRESVEEGVSRGSQEEAKRKPRGSHEEATRKPRGSHEEATRKPRGSQEEATRKPRGSQEEATRKPRGSHEEATRKPRGSQEEATRKPRGSHEEAKRKPRGSHEEAKRKPRGSQEEASVLEEDEVERRCVEHRRPLRVAPEPDVALTADCVHLQLTASCPVCSAAPSRPRRVKADKSGTKRTSSPPRPRRTDEPTASCGGLHLHPLLSGGRRLLPQTRGTVSAPLSTWSDVTPLTVEERRRGGLHRGGLHRGGLHIRGRSVLPAPLMLLWKRILQRRSMSPTDMKASDRTPRASRGDNAGTRAEELT